MNKKISGTLRNLMVATLVGGSLLVGVSSAHAQLSMDYALGTSGSPSISYDPSVGYVTGSNIAVTTITGNETTQNSGNPLSISGGALNFQTGMYTTTSGNTLNFGSGGNLSVIGGITPLNIGAGSTLLSGTFSSAEVSQYQVGILRFDFLGATLSTTDLPLIYSYFGITATSGSVAGLDLTFFASGTIDGGFTSNGINSGSITDVPTPTPIPAAAWLLGSGLMGLVGLRRKGKNQ